MESGECLAPVLNRAVPQYGSTAISHYPSLVTRHPSLVTCYSYLAHGWLGANSFSAAYLLWTFILKKFWRTHLRHSTPSSSLRHFVTPLLLLEWPLRYRSTPSNRPLRPWTTRRSIGIFPHPSPPRRVCRRYRRTAAGTSDRTGARASATSTPGARPRRRSAVCRMARSISA